MNNEGKINYVGLFEGISGFGLAFKRVGANIMAVCEIDKTCQSVLRRHHPEAEIISDVKTITKESFGNEAIDVLAGGFPCQDLSVAGLRKGLDGERSGLWFEFLRIITDHKPRIVVIENVPGLLSSNGGRDFAVILRGMVECGYGVCWRVLDSQYDGVAQRRARVFIVASFGSERCVEILFERDGSAWDSPPSRGAGQDVAGTLAAGTHPSGFNGQDAYQGKLIHTFGRVGIGEYANRPATLMEKGGDCQGGLSILGQLGVRRLMPTECEALQGFPRNWTAFGDDGKPISDSARYRMLGNAVCVPTTEWIAKRVMEQL